MKTGYVYIVALRGRFGRVLRLGTSLRDPSERLRRLARARGGRPRLIGYEFVEDRSAAESEVGAALRDVRLGGRARTVRCGAERARAVLKRAADRQAGIRKARFHAETGLLVDPDIEVSGPVAQFSQSLVALLEREAGGDLDKLPVFLHPYMVGTIATMFRASQSKTKIPDEYLPEILRDIAWRLWKCRLKPRVFMRMAQRTKREQSYLDLARFTFEQQKRSRRAPAFPDAQLVAFMRAPRVHLDQTMRGYAAALNRAPAAKVRSILYRTAQLLLLIGMVFTLDAVITGPEPGRWISALLMVFFAGAAALAFNLYDKPDLTHGLGFLSRKEVEAELKAIEVQGIDIV